LNVIVRRDVSLRERTLDWDSWDCFLVELRDLRWEDELEVVDFAVDSDSDAIDVDFEIQGEAETEVVAVQVHCVHIRFLFAYLTETFLAQPEELFEVDFFAMSDVRIGKVDSDTHDASLEIVGDGDC
jgi:hypothetical protein